MKFPSGLALGIASLLLSAAMKDDPALSSGYFDGIELPHSPMVSFIHRQSDILALLPAVPFGYLCLTSKRSLAAKGVTSMLLFSIAAVVSLLIAVTLEEPQSTKLLFGYLIFAAFYISLRCANGAMGRKQAYERYAEGIFLFFLVLVLVNMLEWAQGYGRFASNPRFYGSASHPNFLAVQLAAGIPFALWHARRSDGWLTRAVCVLASAGGIFLLVQTGSRTGLVVAGSAVFMTFWVEGRRSPATGLAIPLTAIVAVFLASALDLSFIGGDTFDRGELSNDRSEAWSLMIDAIERSPLIGYGHTVFASENSYLRGWVSYGMIYFLFMTAAVTSTVFNLCNFASTEGASSAALLGGMASGLAIGGAFEGYLIDSFSVPIVLFALCAAASDAVGAHGRKAIVLSQKSALDGSIFYRRLDRSR